MRFAISKLFVCSSFLICLTGFAQDENNSSKVLINDFVNFSANLVTKHSKNNSALSPIQKVDSIAEAEDMARHFAAKYSESMKKIELQMQDFDSSAQTFIRIFENNFANYFLDAYYANQVGQLSTESEWKFFFSHPELKPWQLVLLGVNAHTNIDIWKSLVDNFSEKEIRNYKKHILICQHAIAKVYSDFFDEVIREKSYLQFINSFTKGFAKITGERLVYKWRKRNVNLAILYHHNRKKFEKRYALIKRKKEKTDELIVRK